MRPAGGGGGHEEAGPGGAHPPHPSRWYLGVTVSQMSVWRLRAALNLWRQEKTGQEHRSASQAVTSTPSNFMG